MNVADNDLVVTFIAKFCRIEILDLCDSDRAYQKKAESSYSDSERLQDHFNCVVGL